MPGGGRTIYIAGAGIAGLTLALALAKFGASVVILERGKAVQEFGAGLQVSPNARRVLNQLGLDKPIAARSFEPAGIDLYPFRSKAPLTTLTLGKTVRERFGAPYAVMHRGDLADALYRAVRRFASVEIAYGVRRFDVVGHSRGVAVTIEEQDGRTRTARAFAFVGADGVNSATRTQLLKGPPAEYQHRVAWRRLFDIGALAGIVAPDRTSVLFGPGYHAVCYPLPYRGKMNVALFAREPRDRAFGTPPPSSQSSAETVESGQ
jgi:salicylate hydroxylase